MPSFRQWLSTSCIRRRRTRTGRLGPSLDQHASQTWRDLYIAALFETDKNRMAQRIAEAKEALVLRARELFHDSGDHLQEESAIDDTLQALQVLEQYRSRLCFPRSG